MADYDVGALALVVPATSGPKSTYRPAVSVRNNGIHDALASGYLRIYSAGLLMFESELYSGTITPGNTGNAQTVGYWTPTEEGQYTVHAYLTTPLDQVESNNMLAPVTITITGEEPPVPPVVTAHAAQHEEGGTDELSIDGLPGRAADPQTALAHAAAHQAGGSDTLNVGSLQGILAQDQPAQVHSNTRHNPVMSTAAELTAHAGSIAAHTAATNLANRDTTGPHTGLVPLAQLQLGTVSPASDYNAFRFDRFFGPAKHASIGANPATVKVTDATSPLDIITLAAPADYISADMQFIIEAHLFIYTLASAPGTVTLDLMIGNTVIASCPVDFDGAVSHLAKVSAGLIGRTATSAYGYVDVLSIDPATNYTFLAPAFPTSPVAYTPGATSIHLRCTVASADPLLEINSHAALIRALHPIA